MNPCSPLNIPDVPFWNQFTVPNASSVMRRTNRSPSFARTLPERMPIPSYDPMLNPPRLKRKRCQRQKFIVDSNQETPPKKRPKRTAKKLKKIVRKPKKKTQLKKGRTKK